MNYLVTILLFKDCLIGEVVTAVALLVEVSGDKCDQEKSVCVCHIY